MPRRAPETLADYLVVAICPTLIALLVGSLMWFLVEVFYQGEHKWRLLWIMTMFVIAIVGIARISMEEGLAYASLFAVPLAASLMLVLTSLVRDGIFVGGPLMALVWWAAHKLTWDCTLIDDTQDASGQGLLQQMGLDPSAPPATNAPPGTTMAVGDLESTTTAKPPPARPWWETWLEPDRRPHAPGVWVVYFSLAALPLFGIGGWFVSDPSARFFVFSLLVVYVACGMALLLATSFLGLRRYLRQRRLQMPLEMTTTWIIVGLLMIVATLIAATILPRPSREHSLSQLPFTVTSAVRRASRFAVGNEGTRDDSAKNAATADAQQSQTTDRQGGSRTEKANKPEAQARGPAAERGKTRDSADSGKSQSSSSSDNGKSGKAQSSGSKGGESKGRNAEANSDKRSPQDSQQDSSKSSQQQNQQSDQNPPRDQSQQQDTPSNQRSGNRISFNPLSLIAKLLAFGIQWIFYGALAVGLVVAAWIYREELAAAWKKLMDELREFWNSWFGKKKSPHEAAIPTDVIAPPRTFASFADPFASGDARLMSWPQLVRYTFEALEAWGREHACARDSGQTPNEYALALSAAEPSIAAHVPSLAVWYSQLAYAPKAAPGSPDTLRDLWFALGASRTTISAA